MESMRLDPVLHLHTLINATSCPHDYSNALSWRRQKRCSNCRRSSCSTDLPANIIFGQVTRDCTDRPAHLKKVMNPTSRLCCRLVGRKYSSGTLMVDSLGEDTRRSAEFV